MAHGCQQRQEYARAGTPATIIKTTTAETLSTVGKPAKQGPDANDSMYPRRSKNVASNVQ
jgi:hypothetical protein